MKGLQHRNGLFVASSAQSTGYNKAWIRDCVYEAIGLETAHTEDSIKTYQALFDIFLKHEQKIDWAIMEKPEYQFQYIHARFCPNSLNEFWENWGNKQNDAVGAFLFKVAELTQKGHQVIRHRHDFRILQKLVHYLESVEYWHDKDNGMWEENEEVHASSVGACLAALKLLKKTEFFIPLLDNDSLLNFIKSNHDLIKKISIPKNLIEEGQETLNNLLPRESATKHVDMALLSLIFPYNIVSDEQRDQIIENVEKYLLRYNGVIRYIGDKYYRNEFGEASWTMGLPWLAIIYRNKGDLKKYHFYMYKTHLAMNELGELPELYYSNSNEPNPNTPLGWSQALYLVASTPLYT